LAMLVWAGLVVACAMDPDFHKQVNLWLYNELHY